MERARQCLGLYFEPDRSAEDRANTLGLFARALRFTPRWAVSQAFDEWERTGTHRPSPGNIVRLATVAVDRLRKEVQHRERLAAAEAEANRRPEDRVSKEAADAILASMRFGPERTAAVERHRMARSESELYVAEEARKEPHWSETAPPDDPRWEQLRRVRDENPLIQAARQDAVKRAKLERGAA